MRVGPGMVGASVVLLFALGSLAGSVGRLGIARAQPVVEPGPDAADDGGAARREPEAPLPSVALTGPVTCVLASAGEATTVWRHGRTSHGPVDETTHRVRVAGGGMASERLALGFSAGMLLPSLRPGPYASSPALSAVASVWARTLRASSRPDIEWGSDSDEERHPGAVTLTLTSVTPTSRASERQGGVTIDTSTFTVHGTVHAVVACARSTADLRGICSPLTLSGSF
jgi:hypothetical protein